MTDLKTFEYESSQVRTFIIDTQPWWALKDVCDVLGLSDVSMTAARLDDDEKLNKPDLSSLGQRGGWVINESGLYKVLLRSDKPKAKEFSKWVTAVVLPSVRKTGGYVESEHMTEIDKSERAASIFINLVRPCESGRILIARKVCERHGLPTEFLPEYAGEKITKSMTDLLKQFGYPYTARKVNRKLIEKGIVEELTRKSTKGEKKFLSITKAGEEFGKNLINPQNPRETQPHWYESEFRRLMEVAS